MTRHTCPWILVLAAALAVFTSETIAQPPPETSASEFAASVTRDASGRFAVAERDRFIEVARKLEATSISVVLDIEWTPEGYLSDKGVAAQRERIAEAQARVIAELARYGLSDGAYKYDYIPGMEIEFTEQSVLALEATPVVNRLEVSSPAKPATPDSTYKIEAPAIWERGYDGTGWVVALLDTGLTPTHSALNNKIVAEACFSEHQPGSNKYSLCFGGGTAISQSTQSGSAVDCTGASGCGHGTRMAGIIAAATQTNVTGVAPGAKIFPFRYSAVMSLLIALEETLVRRDRISPKHCNMFTACETNINLPL
jgi:subtilisin family serine protease